MHGKSASRKLLYRRVTVVPWKEVGTSEKRRDEKKKCIVESYTTTGKVLAYCEAPAATAAPLEHPSLSSGHSM
jgi:hypothetical protein